MSFLYSVASAINVNVYRKGRQEVLALETVKQRQGSTTACSSCQQVERHVLDAAVSETVLLSFEVMSASRIPAATELVLCACQLASARYCELMRRQEEADVSQSSQENTASKHVLAWGCCSTLL